ncbi:MAG: T9SS type A sorting domain-containing protein [Chitinophagaceae bacterium]|nr:T9SS type A sorting domain-containing protein [Chitinophagaceae bacterium]
MKTPKPILVICLLLLQLAAFTQVQWYQNQDGNNQPPNGTVGTSVYPLTRHSFIACYLWEVNQDAYTWKISKSHINGTEQRSFFITGTTALVEAKAGHNNTVYVLKRNFPMGQNAEYILYKLDSNLVVTALRSISFPNNFNIFNLNVFELDRNNNIYIAGDGQFPDGPGFRSASFVYKTDKNLNPKWCYMDSTQTSFTRLHIDRNGYVLVVADFYTFFPDIHLSKINPNGHLVNTKTIQTDAGRYSLFSALDDDDNLFLYGGKSSGETHQAMYLYKIAHNNGRVLFRKTLFTALVSQLNDLKIDKNGNIFTLVTQYSGPNAQLCKISRINSATGTISWNLPFNFSTDSCNLSKIVLDDNDRFYAVGEKRSCTYFSKGFAIRIKKSGHADGILGGPDSVSFQRTHSLVDGITDNNNRLIAIGNTNDFDTLTYSSTYFRSFAVRFGASNGCSMPLGKGEVVTEITTPVKELEAAIVSNKTVIFPNPVQNQLTVSKLLSEEFDRLAVYNMQGMIQQQKSFTSSIAHMDVTGLTDGVYLLVLHSTTTGKEKSIKFVVRK